MLGLPVALSEEKRAISQSKAMRWSFMIGEQLPCLTGDVGARRIDYIEVGTFFHREPELELEDPELDPELELALALDVELELEPALELDPELELDPVLGLELELELELELNFGLELELELELLDDEDMGKWVSSVYNQQ